VRHEQIWAPWRLSYVQGDKEAAATSAENLLPGGDPECFLCQCAVTDHRQDRLVVHQAENVVVVMNRYPYNNGHLLVAPRRHLARLDQLDENTEIALVATIRKMTGLLEEVLHPEGFNVGLNLGQAAGAGLPGHLHWHIVPRWGGDTNFMPSLAGVRVIPQSLEALWEVLVDAWNAR